MQEARHVTFGSFSSLEQIGVSCFIGVQVREMNIPDSVFELPDRCFQECRVLSRCSSALERIGIDWIKGTKISDGVCELYDKCFQVARASIVLHLVLRRPLSGLVYHVLSVLQLLK